MNDEIPDWIGVDDENPSESDGEDMSADHGREERTVDVEEHDLVDHVEVLLNCGDHFSARSTSLGLSRKVLSRRLYNLGWGGVYHTLTVEKCRDAILTVVPLDHAGCNWGLHHVQSLFKRELKVRVPRQLVRDMLHAMRRREVRLMFRGQYNVTEPMVL
jgi:hypothetical protein